MIIKKIEGKHKLSGRRNSLTQSLAPNASNATICGEATPSIEPLSGNVFNQKTKAGTYLVVNQYLKDLLKNKYKKTDTELENILLNISTNEGSVQHLDWLDQWDKDVFKTAIELDQMWIVEHASDRAPLIDQGQSVNLFFTNDATFSDISKVHLTAWKNGVKALYYLRSSPISRAKSVTIKSNEECLSCSG